MLEPGGAVVRLDTEISSCLRRGQLITKISDVTRELLDNAIDAGSTRIQLLLDNYGTQRIEVRDDGHGIRSDQLKFAVSGGHSSKEQDTGCEVDYGFRGEALSSICSFANVTIITKTESDPYALKFILDDKGRIIGETRTGNGRGTQVTVKDLFVKYPVRRHFIQEKSRMISELKEIENYLKAMAIAHPKIYLNLVHNGSSIWSKPILSSTEQALTAVLGIQISKQLLKCGPVDILTTSKNGGPHLVTKMEFYIPKLPIESKLMTFTSNKMCYIIINRRRIQIRDFEKMLQQYIMGAIHSGGQNTKTKYPITVLKIDVPSELVDFNRELDKSKVFLEHKNEILEELEEMLKAFYFMDCNTTKENFDLNVKSNVTKSSNDVSMSDVNIKQSLPQNFSFTDESHEIIKISPQVTRTQNILSFLDDIPTISKDNFVRSPAKTPAFDKKKASTEFSKTMESIELDKTLEVEKALSVLNKNSSTKPSTVDLNLERDWVLGRMTDRLGNVMENVTIVRPLAYNPDSSNLGAPPRTERILPRHLQTPRLPLPSPSSTTNSNPLTFQHPRQQEEDFYSRIRTCHLTSTGTPITSPFSYEPPAKRLKANTIPSQQISTSNFQNREDGRLGEISYPRRNSTPYNSQTPTLPKKSPRQVTLDSLRNWRKGSDNLMRDKTSITWSTPGPRPLPPRMNSEIIRPQFSTPNVNIPPLLRIDQSESGIGICSIETRAASPLPSFYAMMQLSIPKTQNDLTQIKEETPLKPNTGLTDVSKEFGDDDLSCLTMRLDSSVIFNRTKNQKKPKEVTTLQLVAASQSQEESPKVTIVGRLSGTQLSVVKIGDFLGAFSPQNLLQMAPWLKEKISESECDTNKENDTLTKSSIEILVNEFIKLSTDDFTEGMVSRIFSLFKDFSQSEDKEMPIG